MKKLEIKLYIGEWIDKCVLANDLNKEWPGYKIEYYSATKDTACPGDVLIKMLYTSSSPEKDLCIKRIASGAAGSIFVITNKIMKLMIDEINAKEGTFFDQNTSYDSGWMEIPTTVIDQGPFHSADNYKAMFPNMRKYIPKLERLHSSGPVSVAIWADGKKSMVRRQKGDKSDPEKGILYAVIKGLCYEKGGTKEYSRVIDMIHEALEERKNG